MDKMSSSIDSIHQMRCIVNIYGINQLLSGFAINLALLYAICIVKHVCP